MNTSKLVSVKDSRTIITIDSQVNVGSRTNLNKPTATIFVHRIFPHWLNALFEYVEIGAVSDIRRGQCVNHSTPETFNSVEVRYFLHPLGPIRTKIVIEHKEIPSTAK